jgi:predicted kinase
VKLLVFDIPKEELKHRNQQRDRQVLDYVIDSQCAKFEWPAPEEAHDLIVIDSI